MYNESTIQIQKCSNGWLVILPIIAPSFPSEINGFPGMTRDGIKEFASVYKEALHSDPLLDKIRKENDTPTEQPLKEKRITVAQSNNVLVFTSFPLVIDWLKQNII